MPGGGSMSQLQQRLTGNLPQGQMGPGGQQQMVQGQINPRMVMVQQQQQQGMMGQRGVMNAGATGPMISTASGPMPGGGAQMGPRGVVGAPPMYMSSSPAGGGMGGIPQQAGGSPMMVAGQSPMGPQYIHSPASQSGMPSPAGGGVRSLAPSPMSTTANTPQNVDQQPGSVEDQQYLEKIREMSKYIEPLKIRIARMGNEDAGKLEKMKKLMDILSNPNKRMPMETLKKCEAVLMRMLDAPGGGQAGGSGPPSQPLPPVTSSSSSSINPLLEAIINLRNTKQQPINHALQKTFAAPLEAIYGSEISLPPLPKRRRQDPDDAFDSVVSPVIEGEVAQLQKQFHVTVNPAGERGTGAVSLVCHLEDTNLPSVPPIQVCLPPAYPEDASPQCDMADVADNYSTPFLARVESALSARLAKMPGRYTLTQLLGAWEMAVRSACSPKVVNKVSLETVLLGV